MYVTELAAPGTVNTMPEATIRATADHAKLHGDAIHGTYDESRRVFSQLETLGVHYDNVVQVLEDQGVQKFAASWSELLDSVSAELAAGGSTT
jgi:transaldolase